MLALSVIAAQKFSLLGYKVVEAEGTNNPKVSLDKNVVRWAQPWQGS